MVKKCDMFRAGLPFLCFVEDDQSSLGGGCYLHTVNDDDNKNKFYVFPE